MVRSSSESNLVNPNNSSSSSSAEGGLKPLDKSSKSQSMHEPSTPKEELGTIEIPFTQLIFQFQTSNRSNF